MVLTGLILALLGALWFAVHIGRKVARADQLEAQEKTTSNINEFNRQEDEKLAKDLSDNSVRGPWLRGRVSKRK